MTTGHPETDGAKRPLAVVVMGVSGTGKTTIAQGLAEKTGWPYIEADDLHPKANVEKMASGVPLTDDDRWPWLEILRERLDEEAARGESCVMTCSALKRAYREVLRRSRADVRFVHLSGSRELIAERLQHRKGHYMPTSLLDSQFAALEPLEPDENGVALDVSGPPDMIVGGVLQWLRFSGALHS